MVVVSALGVASCKDDAPAPRRVAPPPLPTASAPAPDARVKRFEIEPAGVASFLIDAPLEKIKGRSTRYRGSLTLDPKDLASTRGQIDLDLGELKTETFDDAGKNAKQTEHARNWLGLGGDVEEKARAEHRWARFTITAVSSVSAARIEDAAEVSGRREVKVTAAGDLWVHGVSAPKTVKLSISFEGPVDAPSRVHITTAEPLVVSLKQHDIKPRDLAGRFLEGALEQVGKKIDDRVQITLDVTAAARP